jgi:hypothetical protein
MSDPEENNTELEVSWSYAHVTNGLYLFSPTLRK